MQEEIDCNDANEETEETEELWDADPNCKHEIVEKMSRIACKHCNGWYCL